MRNLLLAVFIISGFLVATGIPASGASDGAQCCSIYVPFVNVWTLCDAGSCASSESCSQISGSCESNVCEPSWSCSDATACSASCGEGTKVQTCSDANGCGQQPYSLTVQCNLGSCIACPSLDCSSCSQNCPDGSYSCYSAPIGWTKSPPSCPDSSRGIKTCDSIYWCGVADNDHFLKCYPSGWKFNSEIPKENCNNGIDDDCNGLIDNADPACAAASPTTCSQVTCDSNTPCTDKCTLDTGENNPKYCRSMNGGTPRWVAAAGIPCSSGNCGDTSSCRGANYVCAYNDWQSDPKWRWYLESDINKNYDPYNCGSICNDCSAASKVPPPVCVGASGNTGSSGTKVRTYSGAGATCSPSAGSSPACGYPSYDDKICTNGCVNGQCKSAPSCKDSCPVPGEKKCGDNNHVQTCLDGNGDGCNEWVNNNTCTNGCKDGICNPPSEGKCPDKLGTCIPESPDSCMKPCDDGLNYSCVKYKGTSKWLTSQPGCAASNNCEQATFCNYTVMCYASMGRFAYLFESPPENCTNGIDDDCNGKADSADPACSGVKPTSCSQVACDRTTQCSANCTLDTGPFGLVYTKYCRSVNGGGYSWVKATDVPCGPAQCGNSAMCAGSTFYCAYNDVQPVNKWNWYNVSEIDRNTDPYNCGGFCNVCTADKPVCGAGACKACPATANCTKPADCRTEMSKKYRCIVTPFGVANDVCSGKCSNGDTYYCADAGNGVGWTPEKDVKALCSKPGDGCKSISLCGGTGICYASDLKFRMAYEEVCNDGSVVLLSAGGCAKAGKQGIGCSTSAECMNLGACDANSGTCEKACDGKTYVCSSIYGNWKWRTSDEVSMLCSSGYYACSELKYPRACAKGSPPSVNATCYAVAGPGGAGWVPSTQEVCNDKSVTVKDGCYAADKNAIKCSDGEASLPYLSLPPVGSVTVTKTCRNCDALYGEIASDNNRASKSDSVQLLVKTPSGKPYPTQAIFQTSPQSTYKSNVNFLITVQRGDGEEFTSCGDYCAGFHITSLEPTNDSKAMFDHLPGNGEICLTWNSNTGACTSRQVDNPQYVIGQAIPGNVTLLSITPHAIFDIGTRQPVDGFTKYMKTKLMTIENPPRITSVNSPSARRGDTVKLKGINFDGKGNMCSGMVCWLYSNSDIIFDIDRNSPASTRMLDRSYVYYCNASAVQFIIPDSVSPGPHTITVRNDFGWSNTVDLNVTAGNGTKSVDSGCKSEYAVVINRIEPTRGKPQTYVTIFGARFGSSTSSNDVYFNGVKSQVSWSDYTGSSILAFVPVNATTGNVSVKVPGKDLVYGPVFTVCRDSNCSSIAGNQSIPPTPAGNKTCPDPSLCNSSSGHGLPATCPGSTITYTCINDNGWKWVPGAPIANSNGSNVTACPNEGDGCYSDLPGSPANNCSANCSGKTLYCINDKWAAKGPDCTSSNLCGTSKYCGYELQCFAISGGDDGKSPKWRYDSEDVCCDGTAVPRKDGGCLSKGKSPVESCLATNAACSNKPVFLINGLINNAKVPLGSKYKETVSNAPYDSPVIVNCTGPNGNCGHFEICKTGPANGFAAGYCEFTTMLPKDYPTGIYAEFVSVGGVVSNTATYEVTKNASFPLNLSAGWNLFSTPLQSNISLEFIRYPANCRFTSLLYAYDPVARNYAYAKYVNSSRSGFWIKTDQACSVKVGGEYIPSLEEYFGLGVPMAKGWNIIGGLPAKAEVGLLKGCNITGGPAWFDPTSGEKGTWMKASNLMPGLGYTIQVADACALGYDFAAAKAGGT